MVATDADLAGQLAAHRAFWQLAARGDNPRHLVMAAANDPAELLQTAGAAALRDALIGAGSLADTVIAARSAPYTDRLGTAEGRVFSTRRAAEVICALPPDAWAAHLTRTMARTGVSPDIAVNELLEARQAWTDNPREQTRKHLAEQPMQPTPRASTRANQPRAPHVNQAAKVVR
jgi:DNA primase